jgi:hypothetical protein
MSPRNGREQTVKLRDELGPGILPRQLRVLERLAARLDDERPAPSPAFLAHLGESIDRLDEGSGVGSLPRRQLRAWICLGSGVGVLLLTAFLAL